jgi:hypothetical protein
LILGERLSSVSGQEAGARLVLGVASDTPAARMHCCWTEPLRALVLPIGVCMGRPVGSVGALARGGRRWRARPMRRERSGGGCDGSSALYSTVRAVAPRLMGVDFPGRPPGLPRRAPAHQEPAKGLKSPLNGQSGLARQTQGASLVPGAIAGLVQPQGHWLARSSQPCAMECLALVVDGG